MANSSEDAESWQKAKLKDNLASYLTYIKNDSILGSYNDEAHKKIQEIG